MLKHKQERLLLMQLDKMRRKKLLLKQQISFTILKNMKKQVLQCQKVHYLQDLQEQVKHCLQKQQQGKQKFHSSQFQDLNSLKCLSVWGLQKLGTYLNKLTKKHLVQYLSMKQIQQVKNVIAVCQGEMTKENKLLTNFLLKWMVSMVKRVLLYQQQQIDQIHQIKHYLDQDVLTDVYQQNFLTQQVVKRYLKYMHKVFIWQKISTTMRLLEQQQVLVVLNLQI